MYWKAYAQNRANQRADALDTLAALRKAYPKSRTLEEARALEMDIRNAERPGGRRRPRSRTRISSSTRCRRSASRIRRRPSRCWSGPSAAATARAKLRERALFVLAQMSDPRARKLLADTAKDDAHPEVQSKAIQYLGVHGGSENRALLAEVYQSSTNVSVKKRVLQAWMVAGERAKILAAATGEKDPELRMAAIQQLGVMGAHEELSKLYAQETAKDVKKRILQAMFVGGNAERLIELAKSEPDPDLRRTAIRNLGLMGHERTGATLVEIYGADRDPAVRKAVIEGLFLQNHADALVALARKESDPDLKRSIVEKLSLMQGSKVGDGLPDGAAQVTRATIICRGDDAWRVVSLVVSLLVLASAASAQSNIRNARIESRPGADLAGTFQSLSNAAGPIWIGYAVPAQDPEWNACCYDSDRDGAACCGRCLLDERPVRRRRSGSVARGAAPRPDSTRGERARPWCCIASRTGTSSAFAPTRSPASSTLAARPSTG